MYIVDKNRDYYDYLSHIYGLDKGIIFDRRGSINITDKDIYNILYVNYRYKRDHFILLEVGNVQYLIQVFNFKYKITFYGTEFISYSMKMMYIFKNNTHYFDIPMSIRRVQVKYYYGKDWKKKKYVLNDNFNDIVIIKNDKPLKLPILSKTKITSLIDAHDIWNELQIYISSLDNDKDVSIPMTDIEKAELHGFDKKFSFRHPVK